MVLDVSNPNTPVLYASSAIDITQDIISLYDKSSANGGPAATPQTPGNAVKPGASSFGSAPVASVRPPLVPRRSPAGYNTEIAT